jgi:hypothetical protein
MFNFKFRKWRNNESSLSNIEKSEANDETIKKSDEQRFIAKNQEHILEI